MAKVVDITEKLSFEENPKIMLKGELYEVNADARTMLEIMGLFSNKSEGEAVMLAYEKLFSEKDRKKIEELRLSFRDFTKLIEAAMELVRGEDQGE